MESRQPCPIFVPFIRRIGAVSRKGGAHAVFRKQFPKSLSSPTGQHGFGVRFACRVEIWQRTHLRRGVSCSSEERRVGEECVIACSCRWSQKHKKKNIKK